MPYHSVHYFMSAQRGRMVAFVISEFDCDSIHFLDVVCCVQIQQVYVLGEVLVHVRLRVQSHQVTAQTKNFTTVTTLPIHMQ